MKQTKNALTMLLKAYRAVFKAAFVKGLASAIVLTAGLSAATVNAEDISISAEEPVSSEAYESIEAVTVGNGDTAIIGDEARYANDVTVQNGGVIKSAEKVSGHLYLRGTLTLEEGSKVDLTGPNGIAGVLRTGGHETPTDYAGTLNATGADIKINGSQIQLSEINLENTTVEVGTNVGDRDPNDWKSNSLINAEDGGQEDKGTLTVTGTSTVAINAGGSVIGRTMNFAGGEINFADETTTAAGDKTAFLRAYGENGTLNLTGAALNVSAGTAYALGGKEINVNGSDINVTGGKLILAKGFAGESAAEGTSVGTMNFTKGSLNVAAESEVELNGTVTATQDFTFENAGTVTLKDNATLNGAAFNNAGTVYVAEEKTLTFNGEYDLTASEGTIENNGTVAVGKGKLTVAALADLGVDAEAAGKVSVAEGAELNIDSEEAVALSAADIAKITGNGSVTASALAFDVSEAENTLTLGTAQYAGDTVAVTTAEEAESLSLAGNLSVGKLQVAEGVAVNVGENAVLNLTGEDNSLANAVSVAQDGTLTVVGTNYNLADVKLVEGASLNVDEGYSATIAKADFTNGAVKLDGNLSLTGAADAKDADTVGVTYGDEVITVNTGATLNLGSTVVEHYIADAAATEAEPEVGDDEPSVEPVAEHFAINEALGTLKMQGGTLRLEFAADRTITSKQYVELKEKLFAEGSNGSISVGAAQLENVTVDENGEVTLDDLQNSAANDGLTNDELQQATVTVTAVQAGSAITSNGANVGSIAIDNEEISNVTLAGDWTLNSAANNTAGEGNSNAFIANEKGEAVAVSTDSNLTVANAGKLGALTMTGQDKTFTTAGEGEIEVAGITNANGAVKLNAQTKLTGNVTAKDLTVGNAITATGADGATISLTAATLTTTAGAAITADKVVLGGSAAATDSVIGAGEHNIGELTFENTGTQANTLTVNGGSVVNVEALTGVAGATLYVGSEGEEGSTGRLYSDVTTTNGMMIVGDPAWTEDSSLSFHGAIDSNRDDTDTDGIVNGGGFTAAMNNYTTIGLTEDEAHALMAKHPLSENGLQSMMAIGQKLTLSDNNSDGSYANLIVSGKEEAAATALADPSAPAVYLDEGTALYFTKDAATGDIAGITLAGTSGKVQAAGGDIIVGGNITADDTLNLIANSDKSAADIVAAGDNTTGEITIRTENNLLNTTVNATEGDLSNIALELSDDARNVLYELSDPLYNAAIDIYEDSTLTGTGVEFVRDQMGKGHGAAIETAARLATFGGVAQSSMMAADASSELIAERVGFGKAAGNLISANKNGAGIWMAPVYKHQDSDSFDADGNDYGADVDLYGVGLGVDYTTANNARFGAMFNIGSGEADGQDAGSAASNDFDYYSLGLYAAFTHGNLGLSADLSYTETDNDLDAGSLTATTDAEVLSFGVAAKYEFNTSVMDVAPHIGLRYSRLDMDDFTVKNNGTAVADVDADTASVFSIPVGVTLSKDFAAGSWMVQPSFDLTVTANCGDTEQDTDVTFVGADFGTGLSAEFLDDFTYGATVGVAAQNGSLNMGLGLSYVGSENTDELGVGANVQYTF